MSDSVGGSFFNKNIYSITLLIPLLDLGNSAFETADSIMGATNLIHMFARFVPCQTYFKVTFWRACLMMF